MSVCTLHQVAYDRDLAHIVHDHDLGVEKKARQEDKNDGYERAHVTLVCAPCPLKVDAEGRLADAELVVGSELATDSLQDIGLENHNT